jgi:hypothetical protein
MKTNAPSYRGYRFPIISHAVWLYQRFCLSLRNVEDLLAELNLTIRQGSAYLGRRTICQARWKECLEDHLELLRCHYNFVRLHRALKFECEVKTPAMQAGLTRRQLTFREIFEAGVAFLASKNVLFVLIESARRIRFAAQRMPLAA